MNRKDIEDFLRRSNSIDQDPNTQDDVPVRRMSLKEFNGLDPSRKEEIAELSLPSWKRPINQSLISTFSARRRSVLSNDLREESPVRRVSADNVDIDTAIDRVSALERKLEDFSTAGCSTSDNIIERKRLHEDARLMMLTAKMIKADEMDANRTQALIAELTEYADTVTSAAIVVMQSGNVYHSQLISTEIKQMLQILHRLLRETRENGQIPAKQVELLVSALHQLVLAASSLV